MVSINNNHSLTSSNEKSMTNSIKEKDVNNTIISNSNHSNPYSSIDFQQLLVIEDNLSALLTQLRSNQKLKVQQCIDYYIAISVTNFSINTIFTHSLQNKILSQYLKLQLISLYVTFHFISSKNNSMPIQSGNLLKNLIFEVHQNYLVFLQIYIDQMSHDNYSNAFSHKIQKVIYEKSAQRIGNNDIITLMKKSNSNILSSIKGLIVNESKSLGFLLKRIDTLSYINYVQMLKKKIQSIVTTLTEICEHNNNNNNSSNNKDLETVSVPFIKHNRDKNKVLTVVLDLDETMVSFTMSQSGEKGMLKMRPGLIELLDRHKSETELIAFTAATQDYSDPILDAIESDEQYFAYRFYRQHTVLINNDFVKDLTKIGRELNSIVIVDNSITSFSLQKENGILIKAYDGTNDDDDSALFNLYDILHDIIQKGFSDIRNELKQQSDVIYNKITEPQREKEASSIAS